MGTAIAVVYRCYNCSNTLQNTTGATRQHIMAFVFSILRNNMSQQKKQHYVPVFYLKNFSSDGKRINVWNISSKKKCFG